MADLIRTEISNRDIVQQMDPGDTTRYRDVYEQQQLGRTKPEKEQTPFTRVLATTICSIIVAVLVWMIATFAESLMWMTNNGTSSDVAAIITLSGGGNMPPLGYFLGPSFTKMVVTFLITTIFFTVMYTFLMRNLEAQNAINDRSDINEYTNDGHIMLPEEVMEKFDFFPDVGAHASVQVSSMISHIALRNKGLGKVEVVDWQADENDDSEFYSAIAGDRDELTIVRRPWIDESFGAALFEASGLPEEFHKFYVASDISYNPGNANRNKQKGFDTLADMIQGDWELPLYEPQRPAGAYIVDTDPVNTMVLAITRAGKGQTVIEPTIDMWLREKRPNNMVINDPKGELLVKNYVPATVRGFQPVQFNLINALKTDIYNPLAMAAQAAREGDTTKCALYVENIAEVFFPLDGGEDPVWPNAANNAFKRAAYGLIDFYMEEEREMRQQAEADGIDPGVVETMVDELWGKVTLYNCYQLFVQLTAKKMTNPRKVMGQQLKGKTTADIDEATYQRMEAEVEAKEHLWDGQDEVDLLSLYFSATDALPRNSIRTLVSNANNALKSMGAAEKMLASVYGIAVTAMSFFTDPTISTLTSGTPSQNVDLAGLSFPRRVGVRLHPEFCAKYHLIGLQARWQAYSDPMFSQSLGKDFYHEDLISREGWARFFFKGILPEDEAYFKLEIRNAQTGTLVKTMYFRFKKGYQMSLDGRYYVTDPVLEEKIIKNGILVEMRPRYSRKTRELVKFVDDKLTFDNTRVFYNNGRPDIQEVKTNVVINNLVRYCEKPKIVFLVTPPHLAKYAKIVLILIKQLVDLNFDQSYMTKSDQKPLYKTRFMLDELGNLQSEGHGISNFETMLSIGLGQEQQFTLILQTLQQLRDVYGDSVDKIVQGNAQPLTSNIATPSGWKQMGDIAIGDDVLTPDGKITQVKGVYPRGVRKVYKVTTRDGRSCLVCNEHLWKVQVKS